MLLVLEPREVYSWFWLVWAGLGCDQLLEGSIFRGGKRRVEPYITVHG